jgi:hypothetical protein
VNDIIRPTVPSMFGKRTAPAGSPIKHNVAGMAQSGWGTSNSSKLSLFKMIVACLLPLLGSLAADAQTNTNGGNATEVGDVIVTRLAGHTLYIPKGYVTGFNAGDVKIQAMLPCLLPETPKNAAEFRAFWHVGHGSARMLIATLSPLDEMPYQMGKAWLDIELKNSKEFNEYLLQEHHTEQLQADIGPTVIPGKRLVAYKDTLLGYDIFVLPGTDPLFIVDCKMHSDKNPMHFIPFPTCGAREKALDNLHLDYFYDRTANVDPNVDMAITIDDRLQRLIKSFLTPPAKQSPSSDATGGDCK